MILGNVFNSSVLLLIYHCHWTRDSTSILITDKIRQPGIQTIHTGQNSPSLWLDSSFASFARHFLITRLAAIPMKINYQSYQVSYPRDLALTYSTIPTMTYQSNQVSYARDLARTFFIIYHLEIHFERLPRACHAGNPLQLDLLYLN